MLLGAADDEGLAEEIGFLTGKELKAGPRWEDESENKFHWMEEKVAEFEEKYPGVEVELVQQPWAELGDSLSVAIAGKNWPDIAPIDISGGTISLNHIEEEGSVPRLFRVEL